MIPDILGNISPYHQPTGFFATIPQTDTVRVKNYGKLLTLTTMR